MAQRKTFGFRSDKAYVKKLIRRGVWEYDVGYIPVTPRENRYLRLRDRLELGPAVRRYMRRHPGLSGGVSVEDNWPREPYLLLRVTAAAERTERILRRRARFPDNLRTKRVRFSLGELQRVQDQIDWEAAARDGVYVSSTWPDIDRNAVGVEVITARPDATAYLRVRYGPAITVKVMATTLTSPACARLLAYRPGADGASITVSYESAAASFDHAELVEHPDRVEVAIVVQAENGALVGSSRPAAHQLALTAPLGSRPVIDANTGKRLRIGDPLAPIPLPGSS